MMRVNCFAAFFLCMLVCTQMQAQKKFLVCGDSKVLLVDYGRSKDSIPHIQWEWDASTEEKFTVEFRKKFRSMDDCKFSPDQKQLVVSSSSGGVALLTYPEKEVLFSTEVGNAHSIEFLAGGLIAVAGSIHPKGNSVEIFDPSSGDQRPIAKDSLYSGHGLVWHPSKKLLYALGFDVLRAYKVELKPNRSVVLSKVSEWKIPGESGHDLTLTPDKKYLYVTEHTDAWAFNLKSEQFEKIRDFPTKENIKSIGRDGSGQLIYTEPEESWWTHSVKFIGPGRKFIFPGMKVYKARWARK
jgi:hypothetical protein